MFEDTRLVQQDEQIEAEANCKLPPPTAKLIYIQQ